MKKSLSLRGTHTYDRNKKYNLLVLSFFMMILFQSHICFAQRSMFRNDASHSGKYLSPEIKSKPEILWKFNTKGAIFSSAVVSGENIIFGSTDSNLYCLNSKKGNLIWKFKTSGAI